MSSTYAIGDIHGRADLLEVLLNSVIDEARAKKQNPQIVFLGDLIDRGPDSAAVIDIVAETLEKYPNSQLILGNHDYFLLALLRGELKAKEANDWLQWGGEATLASYSDSVEFDLDAIARGINGARPHHLTLLANSVNYYKLESFCFVHAGIRPGVRLEEQTPQDLRWIRDDFLLHEGDFGFIVVHGHTITESRLPEIYTNRIAIDTAARTSGRLTAAVFQSNTLSHFLCTEHCSNEPITVRRLPPPEATSLTKADVLPVRR